MIYFSIGSGSSGNCAYFGTESTGILLDAGISGKRTKESLEEKGIYPENINAILITHEHRDHISCLGVLARKYSIPIFATKKTLESFKNNDSLGKIDDGLFNEIKRDGAFTIGDIHIEAIPISHDAADPVAYKFMENGKEIVAITDFGDYDSSLIDKLRNLDGIIIESNHDIRMLETGIYPYHLKQRIASKYGHISNEDCGRLLSEILHDNLKWIVLAHLSAENNYEKLALESVKLEIDFSENKYRAKDFDISIAPRKYVGEIFCV